MQFLARVIDFQLFRLTLFFLSQLQAFLHAVLQDGSRFSTHFLLVSIIVVGGFTRFVVVLRHSLKKSFVHLAVLLVVSYLLFFFLQRFLLLVVDHCLKEQFLPPFAIILNFG